MPNLTHLAAAINLHVIGLEKNGIVGMSLANEMISYAPDLHHIYDTASDDILLNLCRRFPAFERYARLMEAVTAEEQTMTAAGTHPYQDLPDLPTDLQNSLLAVMKGAGALESQYQAALDTGRASAFQQLHFAKQAWADGLEQLVRQLQDAELPLRTQALVQGFVAASAHRVASIGVE